MLLSLILSIFSFSSPLIVVSIGLLIQFPGHHGSATFWPSGYYGYNRDYDNLRITSSNGFRSPLDQSTWVLPPNQSPASSRYVAQPSPTYGSSNYYGTSFPYSYYSYMSGLPSSPSSNNNYYSGSAYPYNEWWKFYSQYPTRSSYSSWPTSSYSNTNTNNNAAYNNYANALAIHCKYASFYRPGHPTYPYYPQSSSTSPTSTPYYPIYSYGSTSYPFTYNGYRSPSSYYPNSYYNSYNYPQSSSSSSYGLGYGSMSPPLLPPPSSASIGVPPPPPSASRDLWSQPPVGFEDVDFNRRMGWLGTVPSPTNPYTPNYHHMNHLFGNTFASSQSQPSVKSARAVAEITGPSGVTGTIVFKQIGSRPVSIEGKIMGLSPGPHGLHIYEMPLLGGDCLSAGDHYNPQKTEHGGKHDWNRHIGDLGNIFADIHGVASFDLTDLLISLTGGYSIVNRTIAISEKADDLGRGSDAQSKRDGNSGPPIACGIVRLSII